MARTQTLTLLEGRLAICRLAPDELLPPWTARATAPLLSITRTPAELSIVAAESAVPHGVVCSRGWRALMLVGPFDLETVGVLASVAAPLAEAGVSLFALATYDTDYILVAEPNLDRALAALCAAGHSVQRY